MSNSRTLAETIRQDFGLPVAIIATLVVWFLPETAGLPPDGKKALALFAGIFILYLSESLPLVATSILVVPAAALLGIAKVGPALAPFASSMARCSASAMWALNADCPSMYCQGEAERPPSNSVIKCCRKDFPHDDGPAKTSTCPGRKSPRFSEARRNFNQAFNTSA